MTPSEFKESINKLVAMYLEGAITSGELHISIGSKIYEYDLFIESKLNDVLREMDKNK